MASIQGDVCLCVLAVCCLCCCCCGACGCCLQRCCSLLYSGVLGRTGRFQLWYWPRVVLIVAVLAVTTVTTVTTALVVQRHSIEPEHWTQCSASAQPACRFLGWKKSRIRTFP